MNAVSQPVAHTAAGAVRGEVDPRTGVRTWRGVPFGASTAITGRFRAPQPVDPWKGELDATRFGAPAMQGTFGLRGTVLGSEDCLNLDIVRPDTDDVLPVVVCLHGGTFVTGASHDKVLQGHHLTKATDIVYVSVNFRLGVLGYLDVRSLGDDCVANPAIHDQILALTWITDNIAAFGGDPDQVTIMGESAGGAAVMHLMCAPGARGLFHRAIAQSPPPASVHSRIQATMWVRALTGRVGLPPTATLDDLRAMPAEDLVRAGQSMMINSKELLQFNTSFMPTIDSATLAEHPIDTFNQGKQAPVPMIVGTNSDEASFTKALYQTAGQRLRAARRALDVFDPDNAGDVIEAYGDVGQRGDFAALMGDAVFWAPTVIVATAHRMVAPTYMYRFAYASAAMRMLGLGAMHAADLVAVYGDPYATKAAKFDRFGSKETFEKVSELMQHHWGTFFHTGAPGQDWPVYGFRRDGQPGRATAVFDTGMHVEHDPKAEHRYAWESFDMREWGANRVDFWD